MQLMSALETRDLASECAIWRAHPTIDFMAVKHYRACYRSLGFESIPPDRLQEEMHRGNVFCFSYRGMMCGYIYVSGQRKQAARINQLAVDEQLWRNKVGTFVMGQVEAGLVRNNVTGVHLMSNCTWPGYYFWPSLGYTKVGEVAPKTARRSADTKDTFFAKVLQQNQMFAVTPKDVYNGSVYKRQTNQRDWKSLTLETPECHAPLFT